MQFKHIILFLLIATTARAQQTAADSLRLKLRNDSAHIYRFKKVHLLFSFDQRNTFVSTPKDNYTSFGIRGIKAGLVFNERHKAGIGLYSIRNRSTRLEHTNGPNENIRLSFNYAELFYEYLFISNRWWDIGTPVEAGIGRFQILGSTGSTGPTDRLLVVPTGVALDVHFKPVRWFSVYGMGGYRWVLNTNSAVDLNNWFYAFGISISTRHIVDDTRYFIKKRQYKKALSRLPEEQLQ